MQSSRRLLENTKRLICYFCKKEKTLCKAHIIPESFFRFMYPNGKVEGDSLIMLADNKDYISRRRVGIYDETILCADCDRVLGKKYDEYGKKVFLDTEPQLAKSIDVADAFIFPDVDPSKLKLFILSILWRCSISNLPEFSNYKLPEKFSSILFSMITQEDSGSTDTFSIIISRFDYEENKENLKKYFQLPVPLRIDGINYLNIYLPNGYKILIKIDSRPQSSALTPLTLSIGKPVYVIQYQLFEKTAEFKKLVLNAHKAK